MRERVDDDHNGVVADSRTAPANVLAELEAEERRIKQSMGDLGLRTTSPIDETAPQVRELVKIQEAKERILQETKRTWRRAQVTPNASRLIVGDRDELLLEGMQANVMVDGFRARVLLDLYYFNDRSRQLEGNFKLRLPDDASLYLFCVWRIGV